MESTPQPPAGPTPAGNSSDFVRKLYKMLEDPSYSQIVRWGDDRDSFVVLECEKFTKAILPKHFKHSNFASFVRQLNKYDFHKVRQNNEETGQSPYGPNAWEFKHPEFKADNKDSLDNIRRKAPAPRKQTQVHEDSIPTQQIDLMNQQLVAQQQQIQHLSDRYAQVTVDQQIMMQEIRRMQKSTMTQEQVIQYVMHYLRNLDARQKRGSQAAAAFQNQGDITANSELSPSQMPSADDIPASPLQHAMKLLSDMGNEIQFNLTSLDNMGDMQNRLTGPAPTPPIDQAQRNGVVRPPTSGGSSSTLGYSKLNGELEQVVYPVGVTNGIDPMYSEHMNNISYSLPPKELEQPDTRPLYQEGRKKSMHPDPGWIRQPRILLVEDDQTCRNIGGKFLHSFCCYIETALDGLEAVNKVQHSPKFDLILMDIIMPNLDGVTATGVIRRFDITPVIAMTSNIRSSDIDLYFRSGMNDVLPKPFTRHSLLNILEKHLVHLKNIPSGIDTTQQAAVTMPQNPTTQSVKEESSPGQSPGTSMSGWQPAAQFQGVSPLNTAVQNQFIQPQATTATGPFAVDQNGAFQYPTPNQVSSVNAASASRLAHRRQASDMASVADASNFAKRQRMFAASANSTQVINPMQTNRMP